MPQLLNVTKKLGEVDVIILRLDSPTMNINNIPEKMKSDRKYFATTLDAHLQMDRTEYIATIERLLFDKEYGILYWNDPWLVFKRGVADHELRRQIEQKLNRLRKEWQIYSK